MEILYKRGYVEYSGSLNANVLKEYNLEGVNILVGVTGKG